MFDLRKSKLKYAPNKQPQKSLENATQKIDYNINTRHKDTYFV